MLYFRYQGISFTLAFYLCQLFSIHGISALSSPHFSTFISCFNLGIHTIQRRRQIKKLKCIQYLVAFHKLFFQYERTLLPPSISVNCFPYMVYPCFHRHPIFLHFLSCFNLGTYNFYVHECSIYVIMYGT